MELPLSRLDLNLLTVFDMLMQERNVTRAAERLHLSQSTVSHALGRLRQALMMILFVMSRREMMPTERAKALASPVRQALAMLEQAAAGQGDSTRQCPADLSHRHPGLRWNTAWCRCWWSGWCSRLPPPTGSVRAGGQRLRAGAGEGELDLVIGFAGATTSPRLWREEWFSNPLVCLSPLGSALPDMLGPENWSAAPISTPPAGATARPWWISGWPVSGWERELGSGCRALWRYRR